jgi:DNA-binding ferritin-like protein
VRARVAVAALALSLGAGLVGCSDEADRAVDDAADRASELAGQASEELEGQLDDAELPKVDWSQYGDRLRNRLDQLSEQADCQGLRRELTRAEADDTDLTAYIKRQIRRVC